jgi:prepilin-type N-terminal cleavage/methylation domain-containing protein
MKKNCIKRPFTHLITADRQKGFSIIELMIVIGTSAVLLSLTALGYLSVAPTYRLKGAISRVRGDLYAAKIKSVKDNRQYKVVFNTGGYQIQRGTSSAGTFSLDTVETSRTFSEYPGIRVKTAATTDPVFSPRGTVTPVTITLENTKGSEKAITLSVAGRIKEN